MKSTTIHSRALCRSVSFVVIASGMAFAMLAARPALAQPAPAPAPVEVSGKYTGLTKCAACHFQQYRDWQTTPHGNAFNILPAKYRNNAECLSCHTSKTGDMTPGDTVAMPHASGVSCESCHGPGGDHANYALSFVGRNQVFSEDELEALRSKIQRLALDQCIKCHTSKAHKPHPKFERDPETLPPQRGTTESRGSFFDIHGRTSN
ncbi:MAG: hypothetical protein KDA60_06470 [Planctomycetales bacterium]|nr:hypothetical protein [Planctomycetales bacterium]